MQDPEQYVKGNFVQRKQAKELLSEYIHLVKWRHSEDEVVLDIGCGSGDVTSEILKPFLPSTARLVGIDISENMINYATRQYTDIEFFQLDIGTKTLPEKMKNAFDHVFSFNCLHWIQDQRQVMQNIFDLLKPGGDMFVYYVANLPVFDTNSRMAKTEKWKKYMPDVEKYIPPHQNEEHVEDKLKSILNNVGFQISVCYCKEDHIICPNKNLLSDALLGINPYYPNLPQELKQQFREDITRVSLDIKVIKENNTKNTEEIIMPYKVNIIFATKPDIDI